MDGVGFNEEEGMGSELRGVHGDDDGEGMIPMSLPLLDMDVDMDMDMDFSAGMEAVVSAQGDMSMLSDFTTFEPRVMDNMGLDLNLDLDLDLDMSTSLPICAQPHFSAEDALSELFPELYG